MRARRLHDQPIVAHGTVPGYGPVFNAGLLFHDDRYHLFARGIRAGYRRNTGDGPRFHNYVSDILVFTSPDGLDYRFDYVLARADATTIWSYEDPRVQTLMSEQRQHIVMTYTRLAAPHTGQPWRIGANKLDYDGRRFHLDVGSTRLLGPGDLANKDAVIFNLADERVAMIHRIHPNVQVALFDSLAHLWDADDGYWQTHLSQLDDHTIIVPTCGARGVGAGAPPLPTAHGLLLFFHETTATGAYTMNVALLDNMSGRVVAMLPDAVMVPELPWEIEGDVDNVVFVQGAHRRPDGTIYLTYGAGDRCVGAATIDEAPLLQALLAA
jgi:predicted GH43/DUF377 family glycosyl hydrolase